MNKISDFIKKNVILIVVLGVGLIATAVLGFMWYSAYDGVSIADAEIRKYVKESDLIYAKKNPVAVKGSMDVISENTKNFNKKIKEMQRHFGFPYRQAFKQTFIKKLNEPFTIAGDDKNSGDAKAGLKNMSYTEDELIDLFKKIYTGYYESNNKHADTSDLDNLMKERENIFNTFRLAVIAPEESEKLTDEEKIRYVAKAGEVFDNALEEFRKKIQPDTLEQVDKDDVKQILMDAMGLPRMMSNLACKAYIEEIRNNILHDASAALYLEKAKQEKNAAKVSDLEKQLAAPELVPGMRRYVEEMKNDGAGQQRFNRSSSDRKTPEQRIDLLVYENPANQLPPSGNIVHILNHYKIVEDVYNRVRKAGVKKVEKFNRITPLNGSSIEFQSLIQNSQGKRGTGKLRCYEYSVEVESSLAEIQKFVNSLHDAYKDYRFYVIQSFSIENSGKSVASASTKLKTAETEISGKSSTAADGAESEEDSLKIRLNRAFSNDLYGKTLLDQGSDITAKVVFRYLVYAGDQLENMR